VISVIILIIVGILVIGYFMFSDSPSYIDANTGVSIEPPVDWEVTEVTLGDKTLAVEDGSAFMAFSKYEDFEGQGVKTAEEFADAFLESFSEIEMIESSTTSVAGVGAVVRVFSYDDGDEVKIKMVVTEKSEGYFYLFNFMSSVSAYDGEVGKFDEMLTSVELR